MIIVGIDVAKDKHDCSIMSSEGEVLFDVFTIPNTLEGFNILLANIKSVSSDFDKIKVGLEATAKSLELKHTIKLIGELTAEIDEIEAEISKLVDESETTLLTVPGLGYSTAAVILAEVGDFSNFSTPDKVLAFAGMSPSTYQSGQFTNYYSHMEKRGAKYLRYALYNAAKYVCKWDKTFCECLAKKRAEGKHYNVAISHAVKKLVRLIFALEKSRLPYIQQV